MIHLNSEGALKQGRDSQTLDFLPYVLFLKPCLRKKGRKFKREKLPQIANQGLDFRGLLFSSDQGCLLVNPRLQPQKIGFPPLRD